VHSILLIPGVVYLDSAIVNVNGKRGVFIISLVLLLVADAWTAAAKNYGAMMGSERVYLFN
jgi:hypothetical protein